MTQRTITLTLTDVGRNALINAAQKSIDVQFTALALGSSTTALDHTATALASQKEQQPIFSATQPAPGQLTISALFNVDPTAAYGVTEMGLIGDGVLFGVWSTTDPTQALVMRTPGVPYTATITVGYAQLPSQNVSVTIQPLDATAQILVNDAITNALNAHLAAANPHPQYALLAGAVNQAFSVAPATQPQQAVQKSQLGNYSANLTYNTSQPLPASIGGSCADWFGPAGGTLTLPAGGSMAGGATFTIFNYGQGLLNVATSAAGDFLYTGGSTSQTTITLNRGENVELMFRGGNEIDVVGGTNSLNYATGTGLGASPPPFDNTLKLVTAAWVNARGMAPGLTYAYSANQTLIATQAGSIVYLTGSGGFTLTLPLAGLVTSSGSFVFSNLRRCPIRS